ncbi:MAG TPA: hypothetical protein VMV53_01150 [Acidimicrobiales bacterium]|nr:hypothetical protein [Acidimicrobiales bacterium]
MGAPEVPCGTVTTSLKEARDASVLDSTIASDGSGSWLIGSPASI